ncbi:type VII toxin-antitoxin system MntA family adenylyltransferase antitoxin [Alkaliphilus transvaalensis]|uniref:type VII toxin-antitoxin system MntA family adenylyltransferase antitoxin n=1 Tax=Alkaliphilus transvaalensis TaxID=114628 RepID=UPI00047A4C39|nr:nucleotidyltransferase domain-containing protein [Alkaliphilus transvaalensis]
MNSLPQIKMNIVKEFLLERLSAKMIIIFGSVAKGNMRWDSDLDIAFLRDKEVDSYQLFMLAQELAGMINLDVDLIDLEKASTVFKVQIIGYGKVIYEEDRQQVAEYKVKVLKEYAKLNEERKPILDKIKERGKMSE